MKIMLCFDEDEMQKLDEIITVQKVMEYFKKVLNYKKERFREDRITVKEEDSNEVDLYRVTFEVGTNRVFNMGKPCSTTLEQEEMIKQLIKKGRTVGDISNEIGVSAYVVNRVTKQYLRELE